VQPAISHFAGKTENEPRSRMATRRPGWHLKAVRFVNVAPGERDQLPHPDAGFDDREAVARRIAARSPAPCRRVGVKDQTIVRPVTTAGVCCQS